MEIKIVEEGDRICVCVKQNFLGPDVNLKKVTTSMLREILRKEHGFEILRCIKKDTIVYPKAQGQWHFLIKTATCSAPQEPSSQEKAPLAEKKEEKSLPKHKNMVDQDLNDLKISELRKKAKDLDIKSASKLSKKKLVEVLTEKG